MEQRRATWWTRWPSTEAGPLWVGLHADEGEGSTTVIGVEVWTAPPASARSVPAAPEPLEPPRGVLAGDLGRHLRLDALVETFREALGATEPGLAAGLGPPQRGRRRLYGPDHYERVAGVYSRAASAPTAAVASAWDVSRDTAKRWVREARRLGLLPAA